MSEIKKGLNLPAIKKGGELTKPTKKEISSFDLNKKSAVSSIIKSETSSVQKDILKEESGLDLVLVGDLTTSMVEYHKLLKNKFKVLCKELFAMIPNMRIGIIFYLDHDSHLPYVTRVCKLSKDIEHLYNFIESTPVSLEGNDTFDEAVEDAFNDIVNLNWREVGSRSIVLFGDAQPHEPEENKHHYNYFELTKRMFQNKIVVNSVYCGNEGYSDEQLQRLTNVDVGNFSERVSRLGHPNFFSWVANVTGGMVLGVQNIEDLVDIIKASAAKDSGHLDELEKNMKATSPNKLKLIEVARRAEQRKKLGGDEKKMLK
jgi:hypothetical protein